MARFSRNRRPLRWFAVAALAAVLLPACTSAEGADARLQPDTTVSPGPATSTGPAPTGTAGADQRRAIADGNSLDVTAFPTAHFADPSGQIRCGLYPDWALCRFPKGVRAPKAASPARICPGADLSVAGAVVEVRAGYFCGTAADAQPRLGGPNTDWWPRSGFGSVVAGGRKLAVLPTGATLVHGRFACTSEPDGVRCRNTESGEGFLMSRTAVELTG